MLKRIQGHYITGYTTENDVPFTPIRVVGLVRGFETSFGLELLSTVHWLASREGAETPDDVIRKTHAWSERKKMFRKRQIRLAVDVLSGKGWIPKLRA